MPYITGNAVADDPYTGVADDAALPDGAIVVSLKRFRAERAALLARNSALGVRLKSDESPEGLGEDLRRLSLVAIEFPTFGDGRGFSWARMLRTRLNFTGEVRAVGKFIFDQIAYQRRVGFDAWELPPGIGAEEFAKAFTEITNVYQPSADGKKTIRELRAER